MKALFLLAAGLCLSGCTSDSSKIDNARFEISQGNLANAKKILQAVPADSRQRPKADSILKSLEGK
jgi:hypothetical protein